MVAVDITKGNFKEVLPAVKDALERCAFFAVDCEMTGLHTDGARNEYLDDHQGRHLKMADSSKNYIITQYGISCFELTGPNTYEASTFNFFVFPQPHGSYCRRFLCDASSLVFLSQHGFDFNTCIGQGVPYMPLRTRDWQLMQVDRTWEPRDPVTVSAAEDVAFVAELVQLVTDWLAGRPIDNSSLHLPPDTATDDDGAVLSADEGGPGANANGAAAGGVSAQRDQLLLAPLNSFRRLVAFQELAKAQFGVEGHPGFWVTKSEEDSRCLILVRASAQQAAALEAAAREERVARIHAAAGFAAVFEAMRAANKPCVGHNCMYDISYGLYSFADSYLPATWHDYKKMVRSWHRGGIWDTKYLARRLPEVFEDTSLSAVYAATNKPTEQQLSLMQPLLQAAAAAGGGPLGLPTIRHAPGFDKYKDLAPGEAAHEAGYDAFMTGAAFAALLPLVRGKVAADPAHEFALAQQEALQRAAAEAAEGQQPPAVPSPYQAAIKSLLQQQPQQQEPQQQEQASLAAEASASPQQPSSSTDPQQQQQQQQQSSPAAAVQQAPQQGFSHSSQLGSVAGLVGRLNLTFSDLPYAALWGDDPIPDRPDTCCLSGLQEGYRLDDVWRIMRRLGLGTPRITPVDSSSCLVTFKPGVAAAAPAAVAEAGLDLQLTPWMEYARMRYARQAAAAAAAAAAGTGAPAVAMDVEAPAAGGAGKAAAHGLAAGSSGGATGVKRRRLAVEQEDEQAAAAAAGAGGQDGQQRACRIM